MSESTEAVPIWLDGIGVILWPGTEPPDIITTRDLRTLGPRRFARSADYPLAACYDHDPLRKVWRIA